MNDIKLTAVEERLLGWLANGFSLGEADSLDYARERHLSPQDFSDGWSRTVYSAMLRASKPDLMELQSSLTAPDVVRLNSAANSASTQIHFSYDVAAVIAAGHRRRASADLRRIAEEIDGGADPVAALHDLEKLARKTPPTSDWPALETMPPVDTLARDDGAVIVDGLFERGDKVVQGGGSKTFKTWCFIDLALSIAHGAPWWGRKTTKGRVLFVNFELKTKNFWRRFDAVRRARGLEETKDFVAWHLRGRGFSLDAHLGELLARIRDGGFSLIVLDPVYKLYGQRNENSAGDMADLMRLIDKVATESGAAVLFGAHFAKGSQSGKEAMDRISGSGVFARDPDCIITLTKLDETEGENVFTVDATLRDFPPVAPFGVRFDWPIMAPVEGVNLQNVRQPGARTKYSPADMVELLREKPLSVSEWQQACEDKLGMTRSSFYNYAARAKKLAQVFQGRWSIPLHGSNKSKLVQMDHLDPASVGPVHPKGMDLDLTNQRRTRPKSKQRRAS